ncbi:MAG: hypothetical protein ACE5K4_06935 [Candidatus Hydrothermarchaeota archaeon]
MEGITEFESQLIKEYSNCYDVVENMPNFLYARYQLGDLRETTEKIGYDLKIYLSNARDRKMVEKMISDSINETRKRRENFGRHEVAPYFKRNVINYLMKLHREALDVAILTVLCREGILKIPKEEEELIKKRIWLGLELKMFAMLGGIQLPKESDIPDEIVEKISKECVQILYSRIKDEKDRLLKYILDVLDLREKASLYELDQDLWHFFTTIEAVRLLDVNGEFVHDLIKLSHHLIKSEY